MALPARIPAICASRLSLPSSGSSRSHFSGVPYLAIPVNATVMLCGTGACAPLIVMLPMSPVPAYSLLDGAKMTLIVHEPAAKLVPHVPGAVLKSLLPLKLTLKPVRLGFPAGLVTVRVRDLLEPVATCPKASPVAGDTVIGATPVPLRTTELKAPGAATVMLICPLTAPAFTGRKLTETVQVAAGASVAGNGPQLLVWKNCPVLVMPVIVSLASGLLLLMVTVCGAVAAPAA